MLSAGAAAAAVLAVSRPEPLPPQCDAEPPAWINDGFAEHVAILPPGAPPRLERFARRWSAARTLVCDPDADLRLPTRAEQAACLERARVVFETAAHELTLPASAEASTRRAKRQLWGLPSPQRCTGEDVSSYFARTSEEEAELDAIQSRMVELLKSPPDPAQVDAFIGRSIARAEALHDHGIATGLLTLHARITHQGGDYEAAARMDTEAAWRCEAADDPLLAAEHLSNAAASLTSAGAPPAEVDRLIAQALEMAEAAGNPTEIAVELGGARAYVASSRGDFDSALELAYEVMRRAEADPSPGVRATMTRALDLAATAHINRGESYLALPLQRRALEMSRPDDRHGNEKIAFIHRGMAFAAFQSGEPELALESELASLALLGEVYAPDHPGLLWDVAFYGFMLAERGQVDEGIAHMEHARRVLLQAPRAPELASVLANLATAWVAAGRFEEAERDGQEAIERFTEQFGPASPQVAAVQQTVAEARLAQGDLPGARQALAAARDAMQAFGDPGPGHALVSARIHMAEGAWDVARAELLVALEGLGPAQLDQSSVGGRGLVYALLARIFAEQGDLDAARVMARFADPLLLRGGQVHRSHRDEIAAWLDGT